MSPTTAQLVALTEIWRGVGSGTAVDTKEDVLRTCRKCTLGTSSPTTRRLPIVLLYWGIQRPRCERPRIRKAAVCVDLSPQVADRTPPPQVCDQKIHRPSNPAHHKRPLCRPSPLATTRGQPCLRAHARRAAQAEAETDFDRRCGHSARSGSKLRKVCRTTSAQVVSAASGPATFAAAARSSTSPPQSSSLLLQVLWLNPAAADPSLSSSTVVVCWLKHTGGEPVPRSTSPWDLLLFDAMRLTFKTSSSLICARKVVIFRCISSS